MSKHSDHSFVQTECGCITRCLLIDPFLREMIAFYHFICNFYTSFLSIINWITQHWNFVWTHKTSDIWKRWFFWQSLFRLDGTNTMSGNIGGQETVVKKVAVMATYVNCRCLRLGLLLIHLIKRCPVLSEAHSCLLHVWEIFKFSTCHEKINSYHIGTWYCF